MPKEIGAPVRAQCPSAQAGLDDAMVLGVVVEQDGALGAALLSELIPLSAVGPLIPEDISPSKVVRLTAPCAASACRHYDGSRCTLASRVVAGLPEVTERLAACAIRATCRWRLQEGVAACRRCPQIATEPAFPDERLRNVAAPPTKDFHDASKGEESWERKN